MSNLGRIVVDPESAGRQSRLVADGTFLLYADLHNHSLLSDGLGDPDQAFQQMRSAGLDVAALTDHASIPISRHLDLTSYPDTEALALARAAPRSFDAAGWALTGEIERAHDRPGEFTALRGFEWTEPWLGHVNVWFSDTYLPVTTPGQVSGLHEWLAREEPHALFGYNHPGREPGRLHDFAGPDATYLIDAETTGLTTRMVSLELFNRAYDFLFSGYRDGLGSPILACLDSGWRPGFIGCSDEHGRTYGLAGRGRAGLWASEHSSGGVREALTSARTFATLERDLHVDATLDGVRMGACVASGADHELAVNIAADADDVQLPSGKTLHLQVLGSDPSGIPAVHGVFDAVVGAVTRVTFRRPPEATWLFVRIADPTRTNDTPGPAGHPANARAIAYCSPWWFTSVARRARSGSRSSA